MAVYSVGGDSDADTTNNLEAALIAAGIRTTTHYKTTNRLIVTTTRSNKVLRFVIASKRIQTYVGDSWSSGDAVTNQRNIQAAGSGGTPVSTVVIVTADALLINCGWTSYASYALLGQLDNAGSDYCALGWFQDGEGAQSWQYNLSTGNLLWVHSPLRYPAASAGGYYYSGPLVCTEGGVVTATGIKSLRALGRANSTTWAYQVHGDDVALNGGQANNVVTTLSNAYFPTNLLLVNGNGWSPG